MTDNEIYKKYLESLPEVENGTISKTDLAIQLGFGGVKRPDDKMRRWIKSYEKKECNKQEHEKHHTPHHIVKKDIENVEVKEDAYLSVMNTFFNDKDNIEALIKMVGEYRTKDDKEDLEILDINIPAEYRRISNTQRSIRCNPTLWKDWEKILRENHNLKDLSQSQLLNLTLFWAIEKIR